MIITPSRHLIGYQVNSTTNLQRRNAFDNLINFLVVIISFGLIIQSSLVLWPLGNYSTLVYLVFYLPLAALILHRPAYTLSFVKLSNPNLFALVVALLAWVLLTSIWANNDQGFEPLFRKTLKTVLLILFFIFGVAILARNSASIFQRALLIICLASSSMMILTIINQITQGNYFSPYYRLEALGIDGWTSTVNPVVAGIYSGWLTGLASLLLLDSFQQNKSLYLKVAVFVSLVSFVTIMLLARSRTAFLAIAVFYFTYLIINKNFKVLIGLGLFFFVILAAGIASENPIVTSTINRGGLAGFRPEIWKAAWLNSQENLWFGAGVWSDTTVRISRSTEIITQMHSHNFYLQLLNWTGLFGLALYLGLLYQSIKLAFWEKGSFLGQFSLLTLVYFVVVQFFDVYNIFTKPSYYWPCIWLPIGIIIGLSVLKPAKNVKVAGETNPKQACS